MIWDSPQWLWLLLLVLLMPVLSVWFSKRARKRALRFFSEDLLAKIRNQKWRRAANLKSVLMYTGIFFLVIGMAGPKIGSEVREVQRQGVDLLIALDVSLGMHAEDVRPSRLDKAKIEIMSLIDQLQGDRVGLILFTNSAFLQSPLTTDYSAFKMYLDLASTDQFPTTGTDFRPVLREAYSVFQNSENGGRDASKVLLFVSDGEDHSPGFDQELERLTNAGVHIYSVGIGTYQGATVPIYDQQTGQLKHYHRDRQGNVVTTKLEPDNLRKMAQAGRGSYYEIQRGSDRLEGFASKLGELERRRFASELYSDYKNRYQYPVAAGLVLLVLSLVIPAYKKAEV